MCERVPRPYDRPCLTTYSHIYCAAGHHLPWRRLAVHTGGSGVVRCDGWTGRHTGRCQEWLFIAARSGDGCVTVPVRESDLRALAALSTVAARLAYLGVSASLFLERAG